MIWASVMPDRILTIFFLMSCWPTIGWISSLWMRTFKEPEEVGMIWASVMPDRILTIFFSDPTVLVVTAIGMCLEPSKRRTCSQSLILYSTVLLSKVRTRVGSTRQVAGMCLPVIFRAATSIGENNLVAGKMDSV